MIANLMGSDGLIVLVVVVVVLFGGSQLPKIARNVGTAGKEFRKAQQEAEEEERERVAKAAANAPTPPPPSPLPPAPSVAPPVATAPPVAAPVSASPAPEEGSITLSPAQLDALLKAREEQARRDATGSNPAAPPSTTDN